MRLDRIYIENFLGHESTQIDFEAMPILAITGPVGSGKSSIIDAIRWCIWGKSRAKGRQTDPLIREGATGASVEVALFHESTEFHIRRNRTIGGTSGLVFERYGSNGPIDLSLHTLAETQDAIIETIGFGWEAAQASVVALQGGEGSLMTTDPSKRKDLLLGLLVGSEWEVWYEEAKDRWREAGKMRRTDLTIVERLQGTDWATKALEAGTELLQANAELHDSETRENEFRDRERILTAGIATAEAQQQEAILLKQQSDEAGRRYVEQGTIAHDLLAQVVTSGERLANVADRKPTAVEPTSHEVSAAKTAMLEAMSATTKVGQTVAELRAFVDHAAHPVTCPNCLTEFRPGVKGDYDAVVQRLADADAAFLTSKKNVKDAQDTDRDMRDLAEGWRLWQGAFDQAKQNDAAALRNEAGAKSRLDEVRADREQLAARMKVLQPNLDNLAAKRTELTGIAKERTNNNGHANSWRRRITTLEHEKKAHEESERQLKNARARASDQIEKEKVLEALYEAFHRNGIPTLMLESVLPSIEQFANDVLGKMPGEMSLELATQRENKEGGAIDTLDVNVTVGSKVRGYEMLSGGQQFRVDLSLRMALTKVLSKKSIQTLLIDEGLDRWQDPEGREAILDALMAVAEDFERVIVITHHPEVQERFGDVLEVTMTDGVSHVA